MPSDCCNSCLRVALPIIKTGVALVFFPIIIVVKLSVQFIKLIQFFINTCSTQNTPEIHAKKVKIVRDQVLEWNKNGRQKRMCSARPSYMNFSLRSPNYKDKLSRIKNNMGDLIKLDITNRTVCVEPSISMGKLSATVLKEGWIVPLIPELNTLTVGGLINGTGVETSGHKYGFFQHICVGFEIVVADGRVLNCSKNENPDLFYSIPWSHGTLGFLTSATLMIIPAKKYLKLEYIPVHTLDEAIRTFQSQTHREIGNDYVEGIMFGLDKGVIMVGTMTNETEPGKINSIGRWYKPWFYKHVESFLKKSPSLIYIEYIPIREYIHRHTKSFFWECELGAPWLNFVVFRYLFGWVLPIPPWVLMKILPKRLFEMFDDLHVLQDFVIPLHVNKIKEFLILSHQEAQCYPIWLCPTKIFERPGMCHPKTGQDEMYVDIGIYGYPKARGYKVEKSGRIYEKLCLENQGFQFLYADVFQTKEQFHEMLDHQLYYKMRKELNCEDAFPEVYDKVCLAAKL